MTRNPSSSEAAPGGAARRERADGASRTPVPRRLRLALASLTEAPPRGPDWVHEVKFDGYRLAGHLEGRSARLMTRNGLDWTERFPVVAEHVAALAAAGTVIDGEVVALDTGGRPSFGALQRAASPRSSRSRPTRSALAYQAFDLLFLGGLDIRDAPLEQRKAALRQLLDGYGGEVVRYTDHHDASGDDVYALACRLGLEGIVSKRRGSPYPGGRNGDWLKTACLVTHDLAVGGFTGPRGSRERFGALLLGWPDDDGRLVYAGKVGTGFGRADLESVSERLAAEPAESSPFRGELPREAMRTGVTWVRPTLVVEVAHSGVTADGRLRHPRFRRVREEKDVAEVEPLTSGRPSRATGGEAMSRTSGDAAEVAGVRLTNPDRVLYADQGVTKRDLAEYYAAVGEELLRRAGGRPLALVRCPEGTADQCFYQKHPGASFAPGLPRIAIEEKEGPADYVYLESVPHLVSLVQLGLLEIHAWGSRVDDLERPDLMVLDLDPSPGVDFARTKRAARDLRRTLERLGMGAFLRTTGGKGLHVVVPLVPEADWDEVKGFAKAVAEAIVATDPATLTTELPKAKREGKVFIDYLRNGRGSTAIVNYSTRSRAGAPVAVPLRWDELGRLEASAAYDLRSARRRLASLGEDPWAGFEEAAVPLSAALARLDEKGVAVEAEA